MLWATLGADVRQRCLLPLNVAIALTLSVMPTRADPQALNAFVSSFERADPAACEATFAPGATFFDLERDLSERIAWFCNAVVDGEGRYTITDPVTDGDTTRFGFAYRAGSYAASGTGELTGKNGVIESLALTND